MKSYEKYEWVKLSKKRFKMLDHINSLHGIIYNLKKEDQIKIKRFYYND